MRSDTSDSGTSLADAYNNVAYVSLPNAACHPNRLATIGKLLGLDTAPVGACRVLELACGEGVNLLPVAATLPGSTFVGVDIAEAPLARAQRMADDLRLSNVRLLQLDMRELPPDLGQFDYIVAHGLYSWIPDEVRAHLIPVIATRLAPNGVAFMSYNTLPGCHLRRAVWEMLQFHTRNLPDLAAQLAAARALCGLVSTSIAGESLDQQAFRAEVRNAGESTNAGLAHDNLAPINAPVYFHEIVTAAARVGLTFLAEAELGGMIGAGLSTEARQTLGRMDRLTREQYLDFLFFRRYRESLLCRANALSRFVVQPARAIGMHAVATSKLRKAARSPGRDDDQSRGLKELVLSRYPGTLPVGEIAELHRKTATEASHAVLELFVSGDVDLWTEQVAGASSAGARPQAFPPARWWSRDHEVVPNLYHEGVRLDGPGVRRLVGLLDGTRTRTDLLGAMRDPSLGSDPMAQLEHLLAQLAASAVLVDRSPSA